MIAVADHGPALLFEDVKGSAMPLAINVFGTERRMAKAGGASGSANPVTMA